MSANRILTLHVGTPKSGTTSLQGILSRNRKVLGSQGVLYPGQAPSHFLEVVGLRGSTFHGHTFDEAESAWEALVREIHDHDGPALVSHELLGGSRGPVIKRAVEAFPGHQLRVVVTCRDLGRQLPAVWQENVKNGDTVGYGDFLVAAVDGWTGPGTKAGLWRAQNLVGIGRRWGRAIGADNVRFVTVPPPDADPAVLWHRFCEGAGLPKADYAKVQARRNASLGAVETELLRRIVSRLPDDVPRPTYVRQVKRRLTKQSLSTRQAGGALAVPQEHRAAIERVAADLVEALRSAGHPVVGDLADLIPSYREGGVSPDAVTDADLLDRALEVLAPMVLRDRPAGETPRAGS